MLIGVTYHQHHYRFKTIVMNYLILIQILIIMMENDLNNFTKKMQEIYQRIYSRGNNNNNNKYANPKLINKR